MYILILRRQHKFPIKTIVLRHTLSKELIRMVFIDGRERIYE